MDPVVLAPGEELAVSAGMLGGVTPTRWASDGSLHATSDARAGLSIGVRGRLAPWLQAGVVVPASVDTTRGAGLDDPTFLVRFEPSPSSMKLRPRLLLSASAPLGVRLDDTAPWWMAGATASLEKAGHRTALGLFATAILPVWSPEHPDIVPGLRWEAGGAYGPRGTWGSLMLGAGVHGTLPGRVDGETAGLGAVSPLVRALWTLPFADTTRLVSAFTAGPPLPGVGRNDAAEVALSATVVFAPDL